MAISATVETTTVDMESDPTLSAPISAEVITANTVEEPTETTSTLLVAEVRSYVLCVSCVL